MMRVPVKARLPDIITLVGAGVAGASIIVSVAGFIDLSIRLLFLSYFFDILDGVVARRLGISSEKGLMLDRAVDRVSQVIAPLVVYASWVSFKGVSSLYYAFIAVYASIIIMISLYRLIYRVVSTLEYFHGLPMFFHAGLMLTAILSDRVVHPLILLAGAFMSALPVRYYRRHSESTPSPAPLLRGAIVLLITVIPYGHPFIPVLASIIFYALIVYMIIGPIAYIVLYKKY
ncbi:MAG: CDP-alcohol phosphatidyltransferase family protein [Desulfurococcales archaeon]|nr:CDP-alcohol phosphatidyltransferase family protein [Desulfurococcales archaeon]